MSLSNIKDMLEVPIIGIIPEDDSIKESQVLKNAVIHTHPKSLASKHYILTSKRVLGENIKLEVPKKSGAFSRFFRSLGI